MATSLTSETFRTPRESPRENSLQAPVYRIIGIVRRQFWIILGCFLVIFCLGLLYLYVVRATYTATATMLIDSRQGGIQQKSVLGDTTPSDNAWIDSQIGILTLERSAIAQSVVKQLNLGANAEILGPSGALGSDYISPVPTIFRWDNANDSELTQSEEKRAQDVASAIAGGLEVRRVGLSYLVNINFSSHDREEAVKIANAAADAYVVGEMNAKYEGLREASRWLQERYQTLRDQATAAERAVVEFKTKNNIVTAGGKLINDEQLTEINNRLSAARAKTGDEQSRLDQIEAVIRDQDAKGTFDSTVPDALLNPIVTRLRGDYLDLQNKEADWSKRFGPNHQAVVNLRNQERDLRISTHEELKRIAESYRSELEISKRDEVELEKQLTTIVKQIPNDAQIALHSLETTAQSYRTFYDNFFLNYTESIQQQSSPIPDTRVVSYSDWAKKSGPSPQRTILLSVLGGIMIGFGAAILRESLDRALRTTMAVHEEFQLDCLALIPENAILRARRAGSRALLTFRRDYGSEVTNDGDTFQVVDSTCSALRLMVDAPFSPFAEAIRSLKLAADLKGDRGLAKVIGLTSSIAGEGKSTVATALATLGGQVGARVILLDCDLRNPALSRSLAPNATRGLLEVLSRECSLENAVWVDLESSFDFLPAVNFSQLANTDQILAGAPMRQLFESLRGVYDYIFVDLSPLLPVVDVRATAGLIDFYIFLIEWGQTKTDAVHQALRRSQSICNNLLGFALNKVKMNAISRYEWDYTKYG